MAFPIRLPMDQATFKNDIIDHYWPHLSQKDGPLKNHQFIKNFIADEDKRMALAADYAEIGSFLTNHGRVEAALVPLEREIRANLALLEKINKLPRTFDQLEPLILGRGAVGVSKLGIPQRNVGSASHLKAGKLLSDALRRFEAEHSFNHEKLQNGTFFSDVQAEGTLHTWGAVSDKTGALTGKTKPDPKDAAKTVNEKVKLPRGVPTVMTAPLNSIDALSFNSVLLRHGYQFKDVAAGPYHGEYTHRLQWHAILRAGLGLRNSCIDIYKSLGYQIAAATAHVPDGKHLYIWEGLFDTAESASRSDALKTVAFTENTLVYTCPENMNKALMKVPGDFDNDPDSLWCLRVLLATRWKKRFDESLAALPGAKPVLLDKLLGRMAQDKVTTVISSSQRTKPVTTVTEVPVTGKFAGVDKKTGLPRTKKVETTQDQDIQMATISDAGFALAWYLRDDKVR